MHRSIGHPEIEPTYDACRRLYYGITQKEVTKLLKECRHCRSQAPNQEPATITPIISRRCLDRIYLDCLDFTSQPNGEYKWVLQVKDHFSRSVERANGVFKRKLAALRAEAGGGHDWVRFLPELQELICTTTTRVLPRHMTPFEVWFGRQPHWLPQDVEGVENDEEEDLNADEDEEQEALFHTEIEKQVATKNALNAASIQRAIASMQRAGEKRKGKRVSAIEAEEEENESEDMFVSAEEEQDTSTEEVIEVSTTPTPAPKRRRTSRRGNSR
ncbi:hypothetical protein B0J14DRAFT_568748 [Halenospora varia]|nr:hypothetical protein B0J14DRAFT_568748 [Halenospora varia]